MSHRPKELYTECVGNGILKQITVFEYADGIVEIDVEVDGSFGSYYKGSIEGAREAYKKLKKEWK